METVYYLILGPMVYAAVFIFAAGLVHQTVRTARRPKFAPSLRIYPLKKPAWLYAVLDALLLPAVRRHNPVLWFFLLGFHFCLILLLVGHLELIADFGLFQIVPHQIFLGGGLVGLFMCLALLFFLLRRFISPTKELSVPEDYFLLILLFLTVLFGSEMDWARRWYGYGTMDPAVYRDYLTALLHFEVNLDDILGTGHSFMLVLHVFCANLFLAFFPFSSLMHGIFAIPLNIIRRV
ncbi:MAG: respiratory nitrate reductase subunit gamma [Pseudomonadota bacterium]